MSPLKAFSISETVFFISSLSFWFFRKICIPLLMLPIYYWMLDTFSPGKLSRFFLDILIAVLIILTCLPYLIPVFVKSQTWYIGQREPQTDSMEVFCLCISALISCKSSVWILIWKGGSDLFFYPSPLEHLKRVANFIFV